MHICQHFTKTNLLKIINYLSNLIKTDGHLETGEDVIILFYTAVETRKKIISFSITYTKPCIRFPMSCIKM